MGAAGVDSPGWRKSSASNTSGCLEVQRSGETIKVRDSKNPGGPHLSFNEHEWRAFLLGARIGEFEWENL